MDEIDALQTQIRSLNHAVAATTCRKTVDMLRQMLKESEARLYQIGARPPAGRLTGRTYPAE